MFGWSKNKLEEQMKDVFARITEQGHRLESRVSRIKEHGEQIRTELNLTAENTTEQIKHADFNVQEETTLLRDMDGLLNEMKVTAKEYRQIFEMVGELKESSTALVEENKHYTTPAKYLNEVPVNMKQNYQRYQAQLDEMEENARKMSVMALNSAIEAGHMGADGKLFVATSEEIRKMALVYEEAAVSLKAELEEAKSEIDELEHIIHHLVSLMKENNIAASRLMKQCQKTHKTMEDSNIRDYSENLVLMRDMVVGLKNLDEEISKAGERNHIRFSDMQEDIRKQEDCIQEIEKDLCHLVNAAKEGVT